MQSSQLQANLRKIQLCQSQSHYIEPEWEVKDNHNDNLKAFESIGRSKMNSFTVQKGGDEQLNTQREDRPFDTENEHRDDLENSQDRLQQSKADPQSETLDKTGPPTPLDVTPKIERPSPAVNIAPLPKA